MARRSNKRNTHTRRKNYNESSHIEEIIEWQDHQSDSGYWVARGKIPKPGNPGKASVAYFAGGILLIFLFIGFVSVGETVDAFILLFPLIVLMFLVGAGYRRQNKSKKKKRK